MVALKMKMLSKSELLLYTILMICQSKLVQTSENPLNGKHLRVITNRIDISLLLVRNATNHVVGIDGVLFHHMEALAKLLNFSYSLIPEWALPIEDRPHSRGAVSYILNGDADYLLAALLATASRNKILDFPASYDEGTFQCLIPYPKKELNTAATIKPFSLEVWILIGTSALATILCLHLLFNKHFTSEQPALSSTPDATNNNVTGGINYFVWGNLVSQGQRIASSRLVVRFVAGAWCAGCFFLVQSYCSTLTSHIMSPNQKPIANSVHELANSDIIPIFDANFGAKNLVLNAESGNLKLIGDKLRQNLKLMCNMSNDCLTTVRTKENAAFCTTRAFLHSAMANDFKKRGTCNFFLIDDVLDSYSIYTVLPKNSPYREKVSQGILRLKETGLYKKWFSMYSTSTWQCKLNLKTDNDKSLQQISLRHFIGAFLILLSGMILSVVVFILEKLIWFLKKR